MVARGSDQVLEEFDGFLVCADDGDVEWLGGVVDSLDQFLRSVHGHDGRGEFGRGQSVGELCLSAGGNYETLASDLRRSSITVGSQVDGPLVDLAVGGDFRRLDVDSFLVERHPSESLDLLGDPGHVASRELARRDELRGIGESDQQVGLVQEVDESVFRARVAESDQVSQESRTSGTVCCRESEVSVEVSISLDYEYFLCRVVIGEDGGKCEAFGSKTDADDVVCRRLISELVVGCHVCCLVDIVLTEYGQAVW